MALKFYIRLVMMSPLHISQQVVRATNHESGKIECFDLGHLAVLVASKCLGMLRYEDELRADGDCAGLRGVRGDISILSIIFHTSLSH
jgi:hypothetical protein